MRLVEELESLLEGGPHTSTFNYQFSTVLREMRQEWGRSPHEVRSEIVNADADHLLLDAVMGLSRWIEDETYRGGAELALDALKQSFENAVEEGWSKVAAAVLEEWLLLLVQLQHEEALETTITEAVAFLQNTDDLSVGPIFNILDVVTDNTDIIPGEVTDRILAYLEAQAANSHQERDYDDCRKFWRYNLRVRRDTDSDVDVAKQAIIESYHDQIELLQGKAHMIRASVAHEAVRECSQWIVEETRVAWEQEYIEANKLSIDEMGEYSHQPSEGEIEELDAAIESLVDGFAEMKQERHGVFAVKWLINHDFLIPDPNASDPGRGVSIRDIVQSRTVTETGGSYAQDESGGDWSDMYSVAVQHTHNMLQDIVYRLVNRDLLRDSDLFMFFNHQNMLSAHTEAFLTDFIIDFFEYQAPEAVHIGMAQFEAVIREQMEEYGKSTLHLDPDTGELHPRSLTSLLGQLEGDVDPAWLTYLRYYYTDLSGQNVRNKIAHGHLRYQHAQWGMLCIILFDTLRSFLELERAYT